jgi:hypothetical protein
VLALTTRDVVWELNNTVTAHDFRLSEPKPDTDKEKCWLIKKTANVIGKPAHYLIRWAGLKRRPLMKREFVKGTALRYLAIGYSFR